VNVQIREFDTREILKTENEIASYLASALEEGGAALFMSALDDVARAVGLGVISERSGLGRESLYKTLQPGKQPRFDTMLRILDSLGLTLTVAQKRDAPQTME
jgi:probable addiction module antidote protein